jgi:hypothetical protein
MTKIAGLREAVAYYWSISNKSVFSSTDISDLYKELKEKQKIPAKTPHSAFLELLVNEFDMQVIDLPFPNRTEKRYCLQGYSKHELTMSLRRGGYLSHGTAAFLHGFMDAEPSIVYLNYEQSPKPASKGVLTQAGIDLAFNNKPRITNNKATHGKYEIYLLNGKSTNQLAVIDFHTVRNEKLRTTSIERTLIDIAVRPVYAGGVNNVLSIYKSASDSLSIDIIIKVLKQLRYIYPYHQAIGFYLDRTGKYSPKELDPLQNMGLEFDFYLSNRISSKEYSSKWRIYYPTDLEEY